MLYVQAPQVFFWITKQFYFVCDHCAPTKVQETLILLTLLDRNLEWKGRNLKFIMC